MLPFEPGLCAWLAYRRVVALEVDDILQDANVSLGRTQQSRVHS
jgi:hypothetical protein